MDNKVSNHKNKALPGGGMATLRKFGLVFILEPQQVFFGAGSMGPVLCQPSEVTWEPTLVPLTCRKVSVERLDNLPDWGSQWGWSLELNWI